MIHLDAGHDFTSIANDLRCWWKSLKAGGVMVIDDYDAKGVLWPDVHRAVSEFLQETPHERFEASPWKGRFFKPQQA